MLSAYLNQSVIWRRPTGVDKYNEPTATTARQIKVRLSRQVKLIKNSSGEEVISTAQILTDQAIIEGDIVDGLRVLAYEPAIDLAGNELHRVVYL